eukprot:936460-Amphidinium_carterae.1
MFWVACGDGCPHLELPKTNNKYEYIDSNAWWRKFYETHYSSTKMRLCIFGIEPLDSLEQAVRHSFRELPAGVAVGAGGSQDCSLAEATRKRTWGSHR